MTAWCQALAVTVWRGQSARREIQEVKRSIVQMQSHWRRVFGAKMAVSRIMWLSSSSLDLLEERKVSEVSVFIASEETKQMLDELGLTKSHVESMFPDRGSISLGQQNKLIFPLTARSVIELIDHFAEGDRLHVDSVLELLSKQVASSTLPVVSCQCVASSALPVVGCQ